jgi:heme/copper-type cytochrome/quinol oxidase subunit 3
MTHYGQTNGAPMTNPAAFAVTEREATNDVRMLVAIAWIAGPTMIFAGWFLQSIIAGSQNQTVDKPDTQYGLLLLFAFITSIPLVIVSLIGAGAAIFSDRLRTQRVLNTMALIWSLVVFAIYFGLFGIIGTLADDGFAVTSTTVAALVPIVLIVLAVPIVLYFAIRHRIGRVASRRQPQPDFAYDI